MARFKDPFKGFENIDQSNALDIEIKSLEKLDDALPQFIESISILIRIKEILIVQSEAGLLGQNPYWGHYVHILQWISGKTSSLPYSSPMPDPIQSFKAIDEPKASLLLENVRRLESNLNSEQSYQLAQLVTGAIRAQKRINTEPNVTKVFDLHENRLNKLSKDFRTEIDDKESAIKKALDTQGQSLLSSLNTMGDEKVSAIKQADALKEWQEYYDRLLQTQESTSKKKIKSSEKDIKPWWHFTGIVNFAKSIYPYLYNRTHRHRGYVDLARHYNFWKSIWLLALVAATSGLTLYFKTDTENWSYTKNLTEILSLKIAVALLFGTLYVSANKNYRIYANLTDQTKHRSVVAKTIRSIILDKELGGAEEKYKHELISVGAKAMFELKPVGHLTKKDGSSPLVEIVRDIR